MSTFVFFLQLEPDVDHLTPIAYRLNRDCPGRVSMICVNPFFEIHSDYRLRFLRQNGVKISYLSELGGLKSWKFRLVRAVTKLPKFLLALVPQGIWSYIYFQMDFVSERALGKFFKQNGTQVVTVDDGQPLHRETALLGPTQEQGIRVVRVTTANQVRVYQAPKPTEGGPKINYLIRPHHVSPIGSLCGGETQEKVLGCARYCEQWEEINAKLLRESPEARLLPSPQKDKLNILIFERSTQRFVRSHQTVKRIFDLDFAHVKFRSRPRMLRPKKLYANTDDAIPSALLIQWADAVVCSATGIALDALYYRKALLYAKFIAPNEKTTYEEALSCWKIEDEAELLYALDQIHRQAHPLPYREDFIKNYLVQVTKCGKPEYDVLAGYSEFYQSLLKS